MDPITIGLGIAAWLAFKDNARKDYGVLTPERDEIYRNAMEHCHEADRLVNLAKEFKGMGLKAQASMLEKRAKWRSRTPEQKKQHDEIYARAMASTNVKGIIDVANAFEGWTATVKAKQLRGRVAQLQEKNIQVVVKEAAKEPAKETLKEAPKAANGKPEAVKEN